MPPWLSACVRKALPSRDVRRLTPSCGAPHWAPEHGAVWAVDGAMMSGERGTERAGCPLPLPSTPPATPAPAPVPVEPGELSATGERGCGQCRIPAVALCSENGERPLDGRTVKLRGDRGGLS